MDAPRCCPLTIIPFRVAVDDADLNDLRDRLGRTRWPEPSTVGDWSQGIPLAYLQDLCRYWERDYDWRRSEARLNELSHFRATIDGLDVHFIHARSQHPDAVPLIITHGWPGSIVEFQKVIQPLSDPTAHGGDAADAFHVVCPSLPGYGFSAKPSTPGWGVERTARAWAQLMSRLGYERYAAQGGDWGAFVSTWLAYEDPAHLIGIHLNWAALSPDELRAFGDPTKEEQQALLRLRRFRDDQSGYSLQQSTSPQTLGYGLTDSPAAQCAWIVEKLWQWSDCDGHPENAFARDEMLDNVMLYWLPAAGASSARLYWESLATIRRVHDPVTVPTGYTAFPHEICCYSERWMRTRYPELRYYVRADRGGHFAAWEQPALFVDQVRAAFRTMR